MSNHDCATDTLGLDPSDTLLLRSNIPDYCLVGFACGTANQAVTLTLGLVSDLPFPESRPIRVRMSREGWRQLAGAPDRLPRIDNASSTAVTASYLDPSEIPRQEHFKKTACRSAAKPQTAWRARLRIDSSFTGLGIGALRSAPRVLRRIG
jgi:hypothetical protein